MISLYGFLKAKQLYFACLVFWYKKNDDQCSGQVLSDLRETYYYFCLRLATCVCDTA